MSDEIINSKPMPSDYVSLQEIMQARIRIDPIIRQTPLLFSEVLSDIAGFEIWLKLENLQTTGSFKLRGASNRMLQLTDAEKQSGVITVSSGNHGRAVSYIARKMGINAIVSVCDLCPENKREAIRTYGADLRVNGKTQDDAQDYAEAQISEHGYTWIDPYDDLQVIAGQGTIALEALRELPDADAFIAPLSGGGLISGIALAAKSMSPEIKVIGTSMEIEPGMVRSLEAGKPVPVEEFPSLASSITGAIGLRNTHTFPIVRGFMDSAILVSEDSLGPALAQFYKAEAMMIEGGSASSVIGALSAEFCAMKPKKVIVLISGRNIDVKTFLNATAEHWIKL
jgi:threonine dehydratase